MTTLDPSHIPFRSSAQAVHRPENDRRDADADKDDNDDHSKFPDTLPTASHSKDESRARKEGRKRVKAAMPPMPDLRFEQSYLLSIRPFLHPRPSKASKTEKGPVPANEHESRSLVTSAEEDSVFHWGREVDVEWGKIAWVTFRDQLISPLVQGALWGWGTLFLASTGAALRASLYPASHVRKGRIAGGPGGSTAQAGGGSAVGSSTGWWRSWVGSWFGGIETAAA